jgi:hypothetical protein
MGGRWTTAVLGAVAEPRRRHFLLGAAMMLAAPRSSAQEGTPAPSMDAPSPGTTPRRRRNVQRPRRRSRPLGPDPAESQEASRAPEAPRRPQPDSAPLPNRSLEAPRSAEQGGASLSPTILHRPLPNSSAATQGSPNYNEDYLFQPGPGARFTIPFRY